MPFYIYLYSPSDFVTTPPAEVGAAAAGTPNFTLELRAGATGTRVLIDDDDSVFDEVDATQSIGQDVVIDGVTVTTGTTINTAYDLINTTTGHQVTSFHFGGDGFQQGAVDGISSTVLLVPGTVYTFNAERTSHRVDNQYTDFVACFVQGSLIDTPTGPRAVQSLNMGDLVVTMDNGPQPIVWTGKSRVRGVGAMAPVRLSRGYLGLTQPLWVSPQHRMLVRGADMELMFGMDDALVAAIHLCDGVHARVVPRSFVTYHHIMFDSHQVVFAQGAATESFLPQDQGIAALHPAGRAELLHLFPEFRAQPCRAKPDVMRPARPILRRHEAALLV